MNKTHTHTHSHTHSHTYIHTHTHTQIFSASVTKKMRGCVCVCMGVRSVCAWDQCIHRMTYQNRHTHTSPPFTTTHTHTHTLTHTDLSRSSPPYLFSILYVNKCSWNYFNCQHFAKVWFHKVFLGPGKNKSWKKPCSIRQQASGQCWHAWLNNWVTKVLKEGKKKFWKAESF